MRISYAMTPKPISSNLLRERSKGMPTIECPECAAEIDVSDVSIPNEILECPDCGVELEVINLDPIEVVLAEEPDEDWGE